MSLVKSLLGQYQDAIDRLQPLTDNLLMDIWAVQGKADTNSYRGSHAGDASTGKVVSDFESALDRHGRRVDALIGTNGVLLLACSRLFDQCEVLRSRLRVLSRMAADEDAGRDPYNYAEIPF